MWSIGNHVYSSFVVGSATSTSESVETKQSSTPKHSKQENSLHLSHVASSYNSSHDESRTNHNTDSPTSTTTATEVSKAPVRQSNGATLGDANTRDDSISSTADNLASVHTNGHVPGSHNTTDLNQTNSNNQPLLPAVSPGSVQLEFKEQKTPHSADINGFCSGEDSVDRVERVSISIPTHEDSTITHLKTNGVTLINGENSMSSKVRLIIIISPLLIYSSTHLLSWIPNCER